MLIVVRRVTMLSVDYESEGVRPLLLRPPLLVFCYTYDMTFTEFTEATTVKQRWHK